jgi:hypothetical protein
MEIESQIKKTRRRFKNADYRVRFYKLLSDYVVDGRMSFPEIFRRLAARKAERGDSDAVVYETLESLIDDHNENVMDALMLVLPRDEILLLESSPKEEISVGFTQVVTLAEGKAEIKKNIIMAFGVGILTLVSGLPTLLLQLSIQVPQYLSILPEQYWPKESRFSLVLYDIIIVDFWIIPSIFLCILIFVLVTLSNPSYTLRRYLDALPPWSFQQGIQSSSFAISLGTLLNQRIALPQAIERISAVAPRYMKMHLDKMENNIDLNLGLDSIIDTGFIPKNRMDYIRDFIGQNSFSQVLLQQGNNEVKELANRIKVLMFSLVTLMVITTFSLTIYVGVSGQLVGVASKEYYENTMRR